MTQPGRTLLLFFLGACVCLAPAVASSHEGRLGRPLLAGQFLRAIHRRQAWAAHLTTLGARYRVTSVTKLEGGRGLHGKPTAVIASGSYRTWQWHVKAAPSLVPAWKAWRANKRVRADRAMARQTGNWSRAATGWGLAFQRAHRVARYLLARPPLPLHATVLLVPEGVRYDPKVTATGSGYLPLTLAFHWPSTNQLQQFAALARAVDTIVLEYQRLLAAAAVIKSAGASKGNRAADAYARSVCWQESTYLALEAGTPAALRWRISPRARAALLMLQQSSQLKISNASGGRKGASGHGRPRIPYAQAANWGGYFAVESLVGYLKQRGAPDSKVVANKPSEMNAVMSVCRAMSQHPLDITVTGGYPPSRVQFVPFFPANLKAPKQRPASGAK